MEKRLMEREIRIQNVVACARACTSKNLQKLLIRNEAG